MATAKSSSTKKRLKDPKGGLTAAGRAHFAKSEGAHLKPGVRKSEREMTPEEMQRKGSFLRRHYGRKNPFKLVDKKGEPTRYALQAQAWGERLPKTAEDVQRLAEKGHKLLEKAKRAEAKQASATKAKAKVSKTPSRRTAGKSTSQKATPAKRSRS